MTADRDLPHIVTSSAYLPDAGRIENAVGPYLILAVIVLVPLTVAAVFVHLVIRSIA